MPDRAAVQIPAALAAPLALAALATLLAVVAGVPSAAAAPAGVTRQFRIDDPRIDEASGLGVGIRSPGVDYVQNDSGDVNRFFALDAATGKTAAVITVAHATNVDWEDLAVAPDAAGTPSVWLADTGDNDAVRDEVDVYRVDEPRVRPGDRDRRVRTGRPDVWRLRYPSDPVDAESLAVSPQGRGYIVTKSYFGFSTVYRLPARPDAAHVRTLTRVGAIRFPAATNRDTSGTVGSVAATSAAISRSGTLLVVRTYATAYVWTVRPSSNGDAVATALRGSPTRVPLPPQRQGEGVAVAGSRLLVDSEGVGEPVYAVALPASLLTAAASSSSPPSPATSSPATSSQAASSPAPTVRPTGTTGRGSRTGTLSLIIIALLFGAVLLLGRKARRFGGDDAGGSRRDRYRRR